MARRMPPQVNQNINLIPLDPLCHHTVFYAIDRTIVVKSSLKSECHLIRPGHVGIAKDFGGRAVAPRQEGLKVVGHGMASEIGRDVSHPQPAVDTAITVMAVTCQGRWRVTSAPGQVCFLNRL